MKMKQRAMFSVKMPREEVVSRRYRAREQRVRGNLGVCFLVGKERKWCKGAVVCSAEWGMPLYWGIGVTQGKNRQ